MSSWTVADVRGKRIPIVHLKGPVGVRSRNFSNERIHSTGWLLFLPPRWDWARTYPWVEAQLRAHQA